MSEIAFESFESCSRITNSSPLRCEYTDDRVYSLLRLLSCKLIDLGLKEDLTDKN